jgi:cephalosporin hydroxylase
MYMENKEINWDIASHKYKIQQIREEWEWLIDETIGKWNNKKNIMEIGCYDGGTTYYLSKYASKMVTIDNNSPSRFNPNDIPCDEYLYIGGDSHDPKIFKKMLDFMSVNTWDFVFIDGDHSYEGVKADFKNIIPHLKSGTPVAFHDIVISDFHHQHGCYVGEFWEDLKREYPKNNKQFTTNDIWGGIGIIWI